MSEIYNQDLRLYSKLKTYKTRGYDKDDLEKIRRLIERYFLEKHRIRKVVSSQEFFQNLVNNIETHYKKPEIVTARFIVDLYQGYRDHEKKNIEKVDAIVNYIKHTLQINPEKTAGDADRAFFLEQFEKLNKKIESVEATVKKRGSVMLVKLEAKQKEASRNKSAFEYEERIRKLEEKVNQLTTKEPDTNNSWELAVKYFEQRNFNAYQKVLDNSIRSNVETVAKTFYLKAIGFEATLQYKNALEAYEMAQRLQPHNIQYLIALGHFLYLIADYSASTEILKNALKLAKKNSTDEALILNNIGEAKYARDDNPGAVLFFKKSLEINTNLFGKKHPSVATNLNNLGLVYHQLAQPTKAIDYFNRALAIQKALSPQNQNNTAIILSHAGSAWQQKGEFSKAIENFERAIKIEEKLVGKKHPHIANYLNNIAEVWRKQSKYDEAIPYYEQAITIYKSVFKNGHPNLAGFLNNLGLAWELKGNYKKAITLQKQALAMNKKIYGEWHSDIGDNYNNLGLAYFYTGQIDKAADSYEKAISIHKKVYKTDHPSIAQAYGNLGGVYHEKKDFSKAINCYTLSMKMYRKFHPATHVSIGYATANLARVYDEQKRYDLAIITYEKAFTIFSKTYGHKTINVAHIFNNLGLTWNSKAMNKKLSQSNKTIYRNKSIHHYQKALSIFEEILPPNHHYTIKCRKELEAVKKQQE